MRFLHTADWHIGKKLHGYDLMQDQAYQIKQIIALALAEKVDAIVIAGDLYDRSMPAVDAVKLMNQTLEKINLTEKLPILAISGNHDSAVRLATGTPWYQKTDFFLHTTLAQSLDPVVIGDVQFFLLPYFEPSEARLFFDEPITTIAQGVARVIEEMQQRFDSTKKQVLVSHFFAAGATKTDSETQLVVGGLGSVPLDIFTCFDYVALGHLHSKNALKHEKIRYSGSLLKYSLSEVNDTKGVYLIDTEEMAPVFYPLQPLREIREYTASFQELMTPEFYRKIDQNDFIQFSITDRAIIPNMINQLREVYPYILGVQRLNGREQTASLKPIQRSKDPQKLIQGFFEEITGDSLEAKQQEWMAQGLAVVHQQEAEVTACNPEN